MEPSSYVCFPLSNKQDECVFVKIASVSLQLLLLMTIIFFKSAKTRIIYRTGFLSHFTFLLYDSYFPFYEMVFGQSIFFPLMAISRENILNLIFQNRSTIIFPLPIMKIFAKSAILL